MELDPDFYAFLQQVLFYRPNGHLQARKSEILQSDKTNKEDDKIEQHVPKALIVVGGGNLRFSCCKFHNIELQSLMVHQMPSHEIKKKKKKGNAFSNIYIYIYIYIYKGLFFIN